MNLLADESVDRPIVERLRDDGHEVVYVAELSPSIGDDEVLQKANDSRALLLTTDKDFGELVFRQRRLNLGPGHPGLDLDLLVARVDAQDFVHPFQVNHDAALARDTGAVKADP